MRSEIKEAINALDAASKKEKQTALKEAGLPMQFKNVTDMGILKQVLAVITEK
jgi:hypothetical protein